MCNVVRDMCSKFGVFVGRLENVKRNVLPIAGKIRVCREIQTFSLNFCSVSKVGSLYYQHEPNCNNKRSMPAVCINF